MTALRAVPRPCIHAPRCKRQVATVTVVTTKTSAHLIIDAQPKLWEEGARIKLINSDHLPDGKQLAEKLTASQLHRAFGVKEFFIPHDEVCQVAQKRRTASKRSGHA